MTGRRILISGVLLLGCLAGSAAGAGNLPPAWVGRVSAVDGTLALRPAGGGWTDSGINDPVASGTSVRTAAPGRAVLRSGTETIALSAATELDLAQLGPGETRLVLRQGRIGVHLAPQAAISLVDGAVDGAVDAAPSVEIDIPLGAIWLLAPGDYDIAAGDGQMPARIAVLEGRARFAGKGLETSIATGSANVLTRGTGSSEPVLASPESAVADDFVSWWRPAGRADADHEALRYVSAEMTGYRALDDSGTWETVKGYGAVWFPRTIPDDWAPYRDGHWRWILPWGWTWIDDMPWGFAPSHYGRWARVPGSDPGTGRWGWVPGSRVAHPGYAPALVAFLGTSGVGLSYPDASGPAVAWFPLAPGEVYWPGYTNDLDAIRRINDGSVDDISTIGPAVNGGPPADIVNANYKNRRFASVVPRPVFTRGRPVAPAVLQLPGTRLANAPLLAGSPQIAPWAPPAVTVAAGSAAPGHPAAAAPRRRLARAMPPHARDAAWRGRAMAARPAILVRRAHARGRVALVLARHLRAPDVRRVRLRLIAAVASPPRHPRLRFAAARRRMPLRPGR